MKDRNDSKMQGFPTQHWTTINRKTIPGVWKIFVGIGGSMSYIEKNRTNGVLAKHTYTAQVCLGGQYAFMWGQKEMLLL